MMALGLGHAAALAGNADAAVGGDNKVAGFFGAAEEVSNGKDTPSGHWEIAGVPVPFEWGYFPQTVPTFPPDAHRSGDPRGEPARHTRRLPRFRHRHHRATRRGAHPHRQADLLHLGRFGLSRSPRTRRISVSSGSMSCAGRCASWSIRSISAGSSPDLSSARRPQPSSGPPTAAISPCRRPSRHCSTGWSKRGSKVIGIGKIGDIFAHQGVSRGAQGGGQHGAVRRGARRDGRCRGRRPGVRQFRRFRHALWPPPRHPRLCGSARGVRPAAAGGAGQAAAGRPAAAHRRSWLRSVMARLRPHARARAHPRHRAGPQGRRRSGCGAASPISARPLPSISGSPRGRHGVSFHPAIA